MFVCPNVTGLIIQKSCLILAQRTRLPLSRHVFLDHPFAHFYPRLQQLSPDRFPMTDSRQPSFGSRQSFQEKFSACLATSIANGNEKNSDASATRYPAEQYASIVSRIWGSEKETRGENGQGWSADVAGFADSERSTVGAAVHFLQSARHGCDANRKAVQRPVLG